MLKSIKSVKIITGQILATTICHGLTPTSIAAELFGLFHQRIVRVVTTAIRVVSAI